jgi:hypothetical protein
VKKTGPVGVGGDSGDGGTGKTGGDRTGGENGGGDGRPWWKKAPALIATALVLGLLGVGIAAAVSGPNDDPSPTTDTGGDTGTATGGDTGTDTGGDTGTDTSGDTGTDPDTGQLTADEDTLMSYIPSEIQDSCDASDLSGDDEASDAIAGYTCTVKRADTLNYYLFDDASTMRSYYHGDEKANHLPGGDCEQDWNVKQTWHYNSDPSTAVGSLHCYNSSSNTAVIEWTQDDLLVDTWAENNDTSNKALDRLFALFTDAGPSD